MLELNACSIWWFKALAQNVCSKSFVQQRKWMFSLLISYSKANAMVFFHILCWHLEKMQITCRFSKWWAATISREKTHRSLCVANYYRSHTFFDRSKMTCRMCVCVCSFFFQWVPFFIYLLCLVFEMFFLLFYGWCFFCWYFLPFIEKTLFCDSQVF